MPEKKLPLEELMPLLREQLARGQTVRFSPRGVSMLPMLRQGRDSVELAPVTGPLKKYDLPLYQRENGQYVLHRIVRAGESYTCMGDNQFMPEKGVQPEQIIAVVCSFTRDGKTVAVSHWGYRLYCRIWWITRPLRRIWRGGLRRLKRVMGGA